MQVFCTESVCHNSRQFCTLHSVRQKFSNLDSLSERSSAVPHRICRLSLVVCCQEERRLGSLHFDGWRALNTNRLDIARFLLLTLSGKKLGNGRLLALS